MKVQESFNRSMTDLCKGIAICIMIYFHSFAFADVNVVHMVIPAIHNVFGPYGNVCVMFFVLLSGYGQGLACMTTEQSYPRLVCGRAIRLYSGYWPAFLVGLIAAPFLAASTANWSVYQGSHVFETTSRLLLNALGLTDFRYGGGVFTLNQTWWYMSLALILIFSIPALTWMWKKWRWGALVVVIVLAILIPKLRYLAYFPGAMLGVCLAGSDGFHKIHNIGHGVLYYIFRIVLLLLAALIWYRMRQHGFYDLLGDTLFAYAMCCPSNCVRDA